MKYKIIYQIEGLYFEIEANGEAERKEAIKGIIYSMKDLNEAGVINSPITDKSNKETVLKENPINIEENPVELASEGQKNYMKKLGIVFNENTTKIQAIDLINNYKIAHGIAINQHR